MAALAARAPICTLRCSPVPIKPCCAGARPGRQPERGGRHFRAGAAAPAAALHVHLLRARRGNNVRAAHLAAPPQRVPEPAGAAAARARAARRRRPAGMCPTLGCMCADREGACLGRSHLHAGERFCFVGQPGHASPVARLAAPPSERPGPTECLPSYCAPVQHTCQLPGFHKNHGGLSSLIDEEW